MGAAQADDVAEANGASVLGACVGGSEITAALAAFVNWPNFLIATSLDHIDIRARRVASRAQSRTRSCDKG